MTSDYLIKKVFKSYLFLSIAGVAAVTLGMMIDAIFVGNYLGADAVAALGLCSPLFIILAAIAGVFANGSLTICAKYIGQDRPDKVNEVFTVTIVASLVVSVAASIAFLTLNAPIARILGANDELMRMTRDYILGMGIGGVPIVLSQVLMSFTRMDGSPSIGLVSVVGMTIVNIALDFVNVFVWRGGMFGMAMATTIGYLFGMLICMSHFAKKTNTLRFAKPRSGFGELAAVLKTGTPSAVNRVTLTARTMVMNNALSVVAGSTAIAALSIVSNLVSILSSACLGVGSTTLLAGGIFFGEEDRRAFVNSAKISLKLSGLLTVATVVLSIAAAKPLVMMFGRGNEQVIAMSSRALIFCLIGLLFYAINVVLFNGYQSTGNLNMANFICVGDNFLFILIPMFALIPFMGTDGVWISFILCEVITLLSLAVVARLKNGKWPAKIEDFLMLSKKFGAAGEDQIDISIGNDMDQVLSLSVSVQKFCDAHGIDRRRSFLLSLCVEEMAGNVVRHAFRQGEKHFIDIRVIAKDGDLIFRMRDDGIAFNPIKRLEDADHEDQCANIGIRLVRGISKSIDYRNTVGLNNLIVRL